MSLKSCRVLKPEVTEAESWLNRDVVDEWKAHLFRRLLDEESRVDERCLGAACEWPLFLVVFLPADRAGSFSQDRSCFKFSFWPSFWLSSWH